MEAHDWIRHLDLAPHPEGGWFRVSYGDAPLFQPQLEGQHHEGYRRLYSSIYYLLEEGDFSAFHRLETDEMWHHYQGGILRIYCISPEGRLTVSLLGNDPARGAVFQLLVPHHCWFAAEPEPGSKFALCGCTLSPGYDDADFEMADRQVLMAGFPEHAGLVSRLTRS